MGAKIGSMPVWRELTPPIVSWDNLSHCFGDQTNYEFKSLLGFGNIGSPGIPERVSYSTKNWISSRASNKICRLKKLLMMMSKALMNNELNVGTIRDKCNICLCKVDAKQTYGL